MFRCNEWVDLPRHHALPHLHRPQASHSAPSSANSSLTYAQFAPYSFSYWDFASISRDDFVLQARTLKRWVHLNRQPDRGLAACYLLFDYALSELCLKPGFSSAIETAVCLMRLENSPERVAEDAEHEKNRLRKCGG